MTAGDIVMWHPDGVERFTRVALVVKFTNAHGPQGGKPTARAHVRMWIAHKKRWTSLTTSVPCSHLSTADVRDARVRVAARTLAEVRAGLTR